MKKEKKKGKSWRKGYYQGYREGFHKAREELKTEIENLIVEEILICHHEDQPTSRLTSLIMQIKKLTKTCG